MSAAATFSPRRHIYRLEGLAIPSVTQVLELAGIKDVSRIPRHHLRRGAAIGKAVHLATEYLDRGELELESLDPAIVGYVLSYQRFKQATGFFPLRIEEQGIAQDGYLQFGYCIDRLGLLDDGELLLLDLDTAARPAPHKPIQTAGYADAIRHEGPRASVHLTRDGKPGRLYPHDEEQDFERWRGALQVAYCRLEQGAKL